MHRLEDTHGEVVTKYYPTRLRIACVTSIAPYAVFAVFITNKAGLVDFIGSRHVLDIGMWVFTVYFFIGVGMNSLSRSKPERYLMTPVAGILAVSFLVVALV